MVLKGKAVRKNFGKRRATRWQPWLALMGQPFQRLGALVFRLGPIRKSHSGLAPIRSDQDPDSRLCDRFYRLATPAGKTFSALKFFRPCSATPSPRSREVLGRSRNRFSEAWEGSKNIHLQKQKGKAFWTFPSWRRLFSSPSSELSLGRLLLSRACVCFTGHPKDNRNGRRSNWSN